MPTLLLLLFNILSGGSDRKLGHGCLKVKAWLPEGSKPDGDAGIFAFGYRHASVVPADRNGEICRVAFGRKSLLTVLFLYTQRQANALASFLWHTP